MKTYNKQFEYDGYKFNIQVELDYHTERHTNKSYHLIKINDMGGSNYYQTYDATDEILLVQLSITEQVSNNWVDNKKNKPSLSHNEEILINMGFV